MIYDDRFEIEFLRQASSEQASEMKYLRSMVSKHDVRFRRKNRLFIGIVGEPT